MKRRVRSAFVELRVTPAEKKRWAAAAHAKGFDSLSQFIRHVVNAAAKKGGS